MLLQKLPQKRFVKPTYILWNGHHCASIFHGLWTQAKVRFGHSQVLKLAMENKHIPFFGGGSIRRDYTFIDDIVQGITGAIHYQDMGFVVFNLGNHQTVSLKDLVDSIGNAVGKELILDIHCKQAGDVDQTYADIEKPLKCLGYSPQSKLSMGLSIFLKYLTIQK